MSQVVFAAIAVEPEIQVPKPMVEDYRRGKSVLPIPVTVLGSTLGVRFGQASQADWRDQIVAFSLGVAAAFRAGWELDDVGSFNHGLALAWHAAAENDTLAAVAAALNFAVNNIAWAIGLEDYDPSLLVDEDAVVGLLDGRFDFV